MNLIYLKLGTSAAMAMLAELPAAAASSASDILTHRAPSGSNTEKGNDLIELTQVVLKYRLTFVQ